MSRPAVSSRSEGCAGLAILEQLCRGHWGVQEPSTRWDNNTSLSEVLFPKGLWQTLLLPRETGEYCCIHPHTDGDGVVGAPHAQVTALGSSRCWCGTRTPRKSPSLTKKNLEHQELLRRMKTTPDNTSQEGKGRLTTSQKTGADTEPTGKVGGVSLKRTSTDSSPKVSPQRVTCIQTAGNCTPGPSSRACPSLFERWSPSGVTAHAVTVPVSASLTSDPLCANLLFGKHL